MAKFHSPLLGYNNNVRHRGRLFHIQTEDSGINHPHVITHLFMDGGRILKSVKKSYAEHVGSDTLKDTVRVLMKEQHKAMFIALRDGQFDALVEGKKPSDASMPKIAVPEAPASQPVVSQPVVSSIPEAPPTQPEITTADAPPSSGESPPNTIDESRRPPPAAPTEPFALEGGNGPNTVPEPKPAPIQSIPPATINERRPSAAELTLDFDALERDSHPGISPMFQPTNDLPPPPKNLFAKERGTGAYSTLSEVEKHHDDTRKLTPTHRNSTPSMPRTSAAPPRRPSLPPSSRSGSVPPSSKGENRYAATRPATIFGSTIKPPTPSSSIFGDELVSDKSLDEVILSYLAEDLEPRK